MWLQQTGTLVRALQYLHDGILVYPVGISAMLLTVPRKKTYNLNRMAKSPQKKKQARENGDKNDYSEKNRILLDIFSET